MVREVQPERLGHRGEVAARHHAYRVELDALAVHAHHAQAQHLVEHGTRADVGADALHQRIEAVGGVSALQHARRLAVEEERVAHPAPDDLTDQAERRRRARGLDLRRAVARRDELARAQVLAVHAAEQRHRAGGGLHAARADLGHRLVDEELAQPLGNGREGRATTDQQPHQRPVCRHERLQNEIQLRRHARSIGQAT